VTTDTDIFSSLGTSPETLDEDARRAIKVFRSMQPTLSAFARALTGQQVEVVMHAKSNGMTDGKKIYYRPSIELGDPTPHDRDLCDKRDEIGTMRCPACLRRENVLTTIYHEIAHISFDSFEEASNFDRAQVVARAVEAHEGRYAEMLKARIDSVPIRQKRTYVSLANLVSPYLPHLVNALEDARVNRAMFEARRGTKLMFASRIHKVFTEGFEAVNEVGEHIHVSWKEQPLNAQAGLMLFCKASGYDYSDYFAPQVIEAGDDPEVNRLIARMDTMRSVAGVYEISVPIMLAMRKYGFFQLPDDPEPEPEDEPTDEGEPSDVPADEPDESEEPGAESGEGGSDPQEAPDGSGDGSGSEPDDSADQGPDGGEGAESSDGSHGESEEVPGQVPDDTDPAASSEGGSGDAGEPEDEDGGSGSGSDTPSESGSGSDGVPDSADQSTDDRGEDAPSPQSEGDDLQDADDVPAEPEAASESAGGDPSGDQEASGPSGEAGDTDQGEPSPARGDGADTDDDNEESPADAEGSAGSGNDLEEGRDRPSESPVAGDGNSGDGSDNAESSEEPDPAGSGEEPGDGPDGAGEDAGEVLASGADPVEAEPIDTGADPGLGGTNLIENPENDEVPLEEWGTPEDMEKGVIHLGDHDRPEQMEEGSPVDEAVTTAIVQGLYFETPSRHIKGVREHFWGKPIIQGGTNLSQGWDREGWTDAGYDAKSIGLEADLDIPESVLGPALLRMRVAFADNKRAKLEGNKKSGRVKGKVLGKRAFHGDERVFQKKHLPGKKDYFVLIGIDISGSTVGVNIGLAKRAAIAQADLCARMGIRFAVYAHTGQVSSVFLGRKGGIDLDIYHIKDADEPWDKGVRERLEELCPSAANLDGHTLEYYRKVCDRQKETHKVILYYTDGKMPAENHDEELDILQREIRVCRQKHYTLLGVGIRTDSPVRHGLSTVQVDDDADLVKVIQHLERALLLVK
jgi:hypothetical protein